MYRNTEVDTRIPLTIVTSQVWQNQNKFAPRAGSSTAALVELVDLYPTLLDLLGISFPKNTHPLEGSSFSRLLSNASLAAQFSDENKFISRPSISWKSAAFSQVSRRGKHGERKKQSITTGYSMRTNRFRLTVWIYIDHECIYRSCANANGEIDFTRKEESDDVNTAAERRKLLLTLRSNIFQNIMDTISTQWSDVQGLRTIELYDHLNDPDENNNLSRNTKYKGTLKQLLRQWQNGFCGHSDSYADKPPACAT